METLLKNNLKAMRFNKGIMTQAQLAEALDVSRQTIIAIEQGRFNPSVKLALRISAFFGHQIEDIFYLTKEESK